MPNIPKIGVINVSDFSNQGADGDYGIHITTGAEYLKTTGTWAATGVNFYAAGDGTGGSGFVKKSGDTITGQLISTLSANDAIKLKPSGVGGVAFNTGSATLPGYLSFIKADGTRGGYIGWGDTSGNRISMSAENGMVGFHVEQDFWVNGNIYCGSAAQSFMSSDGNLYGTAWGNWGYSNYAWNAIDNRIETRGAAWGQYHAQQWSNVAIAMTAGGASGVGTYVFARTDTTVGPGTGINGAQLDWSDGTSWAGGRINVGSWRTMGYASATKATLFLRYN
jgi:hypothetical protein